MSVARIRWWMRGVVASVLMLGIGVGVVAVAHDRIERRAVWRGISELGELWRNVDAAMAEARDAEFLVEPRVEDFAPSRERWIRGPLQVAIGRALPGVSLEHVECRATMCRWSYLVPDEFSGHALTLAPWGGSAQMSVMHSSGRRVSLLAVTPKARDGAMVTWFEELTPDVVRWRLAARGRLDPDAVEMIDAWARAHDRR